MGGGGGAPTETKSTVTQTNLPEYVRPYFERLLQRTETESKRDYEPYQGQRIADVSQDILTSEDRVRGIADQGLPEIQASLDRFQRSMDFQPRQFTGEEVGKYMSPYMDEVIARQKQGATEDYLAQLPQGAAQAISAGAFGGSRQGVQQGIAQSKFLDRLADIEATGRQQAFDKAAGLFQADRAADVQAEQLGLGAATQFAGLGERRRMGEIDDAKLLETIGKAGMGREQTGLDLAYQDFVRQQAFPQERLGLFSSILRGVPVTPSQTQTTYQPFDPFGRAIGLGLTALGGARYFGDPRERV